MLAFASDLLLMYALTISPFPGLIMMPAEPFLKKNDVSLVLDMNTPAAAFDQHHRILHYQLIKVRDKKWKLIKVQKLKTQFTQN